MKTVVLGLAMAALAAADDAAVVDASGRDPVVMERIDAQAKDMDAPALLAQARSEYLGFMGRYADYYTKLNRDQLVDKAAQAGMRREYWKAHEWYHAYVIAVPGFDNWPEDVKSEYIGLQQVRFGRGALWSRWE